MGVCACEHRLWCELRTCIVRVLDPVLELNIYGDGIFGTDIFVLKIYSRKCEVAGVKMHFIFIYE